MRPHFEPGQGAGGGTGVLCGALRHLQRHLVRSGRVGNVGGPGAYPSPPLPVSGRWQTRLRAQKRSQQEQKTMVAALGQPLADRLLALLAELEPHPHKEAALHYLLQHLRRDEEESRNRTGLGQEPDSGTKI
ncbi:MAG: hypothetical protein HC918_12200 [Oscillatoriales cyanobacterium SM2_1_8]|nr:hypothetical protein [Oscillatoriales cyanobacterium SM2_1_8]